MGFADPRRSSRTKREMDDMALWKVDVVGWIEFSHDSARDLACSLASLLGCTNSKSVMLSYEPGSIC